MKNTELIPERKHYRKIKFRITKTQHLLIRAEINGIKGRFILDTGASNTCICFKNTDLFKLNTADTDTKAVGAGNSDITTQIAQNNYVKIGNWKTSDFNIIVLNLSHVNGVFAQFRMKPVNGIIGADILIKGKAILDYANCLLYLRPNP